MARYTGPIVDVDIHAGWIDESEVVAYLPKEWRAYYAGNGKTRLSISPPYGTTSALGPGGKRLDAQVNDGTPRGSGLEQVKAHLLDQFNYYAGILTLDLGAEAGHKNPHLARVLCQAVNDWTIERRLQFDDRLYSVVLIPSAYPEAAVEEIRRVGRHPRMVGVLLPINPLGQAFGHPVYHPIYKAASELGLPIVLHTSAGAETATVRMSAGASGTFIENVAQLGAAGQHYVSSFIVHGVFEKFPDLHLAVKEFGVSWLPHFCWKLDEQYDVLKMESPWVKRWPTEYIHDHVKFSTQPIEAGPGPRAHGWVRLMQTLDGIEDLLCFSTDYPHYSADDPTFVSQILPSSWVKKVFYENACGFYGWDLPAQADTDPQPATART